MKKGGPHLAIFKNRIYLACELKRMLNRVNGKVKMDENEPNY
jgi:hypothetical protein